MKLDHVAMYVNDLETAGISLSVISGRCQTRCIITRGQG